MTDPIIAGRQRPEWWTIVDVAMMLLAWAAVAVALVGVVVMVVSGGVAAQGNATLNETAPYYTNQTTTGNYSSWFPDGGNVSLDALGDMATRLGPYIIGTGTQIPGGTTYAGTLITGLVMVGVFIGAIAFTSVGMAGGAVIASTTGYGLVTLGLAPAWLRIVLLMIIGVIGAVAALRVTQ